MSVRTEEWREAAGPAPSGALPRNEGTELILDWVQAARVNRSAVERRAASPANTAICTRSSGSVMAVIAAWYERAHHSSKPYAMLFRSRVRSSLSAPAAARAGWIARSL